MGIKKERGWLKENPKTNLLLEKTTESISPSR